MWCILLLIFLHNRRVYTRPADQLQPPPRPGPRPRPQHPRSPRRAWPAPAPASCSVTGVPAAGQTARPPPGAAPRQAGPLPSVRDRVEGATVRWSFLVPRPPSHREGVQKQGSRRQGGPQGLHTQPAQWPVTGDEQLRRARTRREGSFQPSMGIFKENKSEFERI